ncbi:MAG TPA: inositol monophosphatase family protein [Armatimonadota bacterium]|nr:inositol monophosphatase family protein [Armatimonadota bacterium]
MMNKEFISTLAVAAGKILVERRGARIVKVKFGTDIVTEADEASERFIRGEIRDHYPDHGVVGEEYGDNEAVSEWQWVIDPLDGTVNFSRGSSYFAVSIALARNGVAQLGAVYRPLTDELFLAERGKGATLNGEPLRVSSVDSLGESIFIMDWSRLHARQETFAKFQNLFFTVEKVRSLGSASLDLCSIASGQLEGFAHPGLAPWDFAAAQLILAEAGGCVTTLEGTNRSLEAGSVLGTNGKLHQEALALLR